MGGCGGRRAGRHRHRPATRLAVPRDRRRRRGRVPDARGRAVRAGPRRGPGAGRVPARPLPRAWLPGRGAVDAGRDVRRPPGLRAARLPAYARSWTGRRCRASRSSRSASTWPPRRTRERADRHPALHRDRRRHLGRRRLGRPAGARHATAAGLVRGRDAAPPSSPRCPRAAEASARGSSSSTRPPRRSAARSRSAPRRRTSTGDCTASPSRHGTWSTARPPRWSPPARSPASSSTPRGSWGGSTAVELGRMAARLGSRGPRRGRSEQVEAIRPTQQAIRRWGACRGWRPSSCGRGACVRSCSW